MTFELRKHPRYGYAQVHPTPTAQEIASYYAKEFYASSYQGLNDSGLRAIERDRDFYEAHYDDILASIVELSGLPAQGLRLLDIGCGWCQALAHWKKQGVAGHGFDPAPEGIAHGVKQGLQVRQAGMNRMDVFEDRFDAVTLMNVLEHLADPEAVVCEIRDKVIRPGGVLVVDVPNEFNAFQMAGQAVHDLPQWWVSPPAHLNYFNGTTLSALLEGNGFSVRILEASFPLEMFLLMGDKYVGDAELGRTCHLRRVAFEANLRAQGMTTQMREFYRSLAALNLGRQVVAFAQAV
jgi:2-polyprenyl-3-methyl-5-hydroxy-6-metoxy-1,4-benzoquinol methylase